MLINSNDTRSLIDSALTDRDDLTTLRDFSFVLLLAVTASILVTGSIHAQEGASAPEEAAESWSQSRQSQEPPASAFSVDGTESTPEDRPVPSVNQTETNESDVEEPVFLLDSTTPAQSPPEREEGEGVTSDEPRTSKPTDGTGIQERKKLRFELRSRVGIAYDDNIFISNTNRVADTILTVTGGISLIYGDWRSRSENFLVADYEASGIFYFENPNEDSFNQVASLMGQYRIQRLTMQLRSQYLYLNGAERDVGGLATRNLINNSLRFAYDVSDKTALNAEGFANLALYQTLFNSYEFGAKAGAEYQILQKIRIGPEAVVGFLNVTDSPFQVYEQIRARATYNATGKINFEGSAGVEFRQFDSEKPNVFCFFISGELPAVRRDRDHTPRLPEHLRISRTGGTGFHGNRH
jgi:hypothetical protein